MGTLRAQWLSNTRKRARATSEDPPESSNRPPDRPSDRPPGFRAARPRDRPPDRATARPRHRPTAPSARPHHPPGRPPDRRSRRSYCGTVVRWRLAFGPFRSRIAAPAPRRTPKSSLRIRRAGVPYPAFHALVIGSVTPTDSGHSRAGSDRDLLPRPTPTADCPGPPCACAMRTSCLLRGRMPAPPSLSLSVP